MTSAIKSEFGAEPAALDEAWIAQIAQGDREALSNLYAQTSGAVYGFALSILKDRYAAEDVMQETYVQVFRCASQYAPQGKPMAWILTITKNLAFMQLRGKRTHPVQSFEQTQEMSGGQDGFAQAEDGIVLRAALKILSGEERQVVMLHAVAGMKHREIASLLSLTLPTVLSKYRRALVKLQKQMKEETV